MADLDKIRRLAERRAAVTAQFEEAVAEAMADPDRNVSHIAKAAGMTRAGVHKLGDRIGAQ